ncbi:MAG: hypothetical protein JW923_04490 [Spirochaetales bacterium]|nr:hypothetical protein [Spirochaetales bacterium]
MEGVNELVAESPGIGLYSETGLHDALKRRYACRPGARLEARVAGKVVDVVLPDELVEIQTRNLGSISEKILHLACVMPVRVVYPVLAELWIERGDQRGAPSRRRSPKRGDVYSAFDELVRAPLIVASPNVRMDIVLVRAREIRVRDGSGSWRRRGDRVAGRELVDVLDTRSLDTKDDWLGLLPACGAGVWDSASLGQALGLGPERARKILYTYRKAGLLADAGQAGRRKLYRVAGA